MKKNRLTIFPIFVCCLIISFCAAFTVNAQWSLPLDSLGTTFGLSTNTIGTIIGDITDWLLGFVITICILALIWGGLNYVGSSGDTEKATTAKRVVLYAIIGLVVAGLAYAFIDLGVVRILV